jgi:tetratricopeptide (TPR) repeat protein
MAVASDETDQRLQHLDVALQHSAGEARLHFHRAIALGQAGRLAEALPDLDVVAAAEPGRRGLAYLRGLAHLAAGRPRSADGLIPAEANTLRLVHQLVQSNPKSAVLPGVEQPLLGRGTELWQALAAMHEDAAAAPVTQLKVAADQNARKPINRILRYYQGVAAMRGGDLEVARAAWLSAQAAGLASPGLAENLTALLRGQVVNTAQEGRWQDVINQISRLRAPVSDRILAETGSLAYFHLGYEAAQAGKWAIAVQHWRKAEELATNRLLSQNLALAEEALGNWQKAAEAWRDMVRRRPRKEDHPDYLSDAQVAALWNHAAECYQHIGDVAEVITCFKHAVKYAPDDTALRLRLADTLLGQGSGDAAETQLKEIVELEPQNIEALVRLGRLYQGWWDRDPMAIWRQVLAVNPQHPEAREALADEYVKLVRGESPRAVYFGQRPGKDNIELLEMGLKELPGHPKLLLELGIAHGRAGQPGPAREHLLQAFHAAPQDVRIATSALHELLHVNAGDAVEALLPAVREIPRLLPGFWLDQSRMALQCKLGEEWADLFFEEALGLIGQSWVDDTRAGVLLDAFGIAHSEQAKELPGLLEKRIRAEAPASGAVEYIEAYRLQREKLDVRGAERRIREALRLARRANDTGVLRRAEALQTALSNPLFGFGLEDILRRLSDGI